MTVLDLPHPPKTAAEAGLARADSENSIIWLREPNHPEETSKLELPPAIRSAVSPLITALRWGAVLYGMVPAMLDAVDNGDLWIVITLAVCLFATVWRTFRPIRLAWDGNTDRAMPIVDAVIIGAAVGLSGAFASPFIFCVMVTVIVAAFGWGIVSGLTAIATSVAAMFVTSQVSGNGFNLDQTRLAVLASMLIVALLIAFARNRLLDAERRRMSLTGRVNMLTETNDLLGILNQVARTLPISLDMREALGETRSQLGETFNAASIGLLTRDEQTSAWVPQIADGCSFPQVVGSSNLPAPMAQALLAPGAVVVKELPDDDGARLAPSSRSGMYAALRTRGKVVGLLGLESPHIAQFGDREQRLVEGLAEALALTLDNARSFGRLRTLGADEERTRIARDLHDRLGQWLTYISLELERIMSTGDGPTEALISLYSDVQTAIDELRETLRQLRTGVSAKNPLASVAESVAKRFSERTNISVNYSTTGDDSLDVRIENELLRILQEALNNIEKHADATKVFIDWTVANGVGVLQIRDDGKGFAVGDATRDSAYGLIGMRERADVIDATLDISSAPNEGSTITVRAASEAVRL